MDLRSETDASPDFRDFGKRKAVLDQAPRLGKKKKNEYQKHRQIDWGTTPLSTRTSDFLGVGETPHGPPADPHRWTTMDGVIRQKTWLVTINGRPPHRQSDCCRPIAHCPSPRPSTPFSLSPPAQMDCFRTNTDPDSPTESGPLVRSGRPSRGFLAGEQTRRAKAGRGTKTYGSVDYQRRRGVLSYVAQQGAGLPSQQICRGQDTFTLHPSRRPGHGENRYGDLASLGQYPNKNVEYRGWR